MRSLRAVVSIYVLLLGSSQLHAASGFMRNSSSGIAALQAVVASLNANDTKMAALTSARAVSDIGNSYNTPNALLASGSNDVNSAFCKMITKASENDKAVDKDKKKIDDKKLAAVAPAALSVDQTKLDSACGSVLFNDSIIASAKDAAAKLGHDVESKLMDFLRSPGSYSQQKADELYKSLSHGGDSALAGGGDAKDHVGSEADIADASQKFTDFFNGDFAKYVEESVINGKDGAKLAYNADYSNEDRAAPRSAGSESGSLSGYLPQSNAQTTKEFLATDSKKILLANPVMSHSAPPRGLASNPVSSIPAPAVSAVDPKINMAPTTTPPATHSADTPKSEPKVQTPVSTSRTLADDKSGISDANIDDTSSLDSAAKTLTQGGSNGESNHESASSVDKIANSINSFNPNTSKDIEIPLKNKSIASGQGVVVPKIGSADVLEATSKAVTCDADDKKEMIKKLLNREQLFNCKNIFAVTQKWQVNGVGGSCVVSGNPDNFSGTQFKMKFVNGTADDIANQVEQLRCMAVDIAARDYCSSKVADLRSHFLETQFKMLSVLQRKNEINKPINFSHVFAGVACNQVSEDNSCSVEIPRDSDGNVIEPVNYKTPLSPVSKGIVSNALLLLRNVNELRSGILLGVSAAKSLGCDVADHIVYDWSKTYKKETTMIVSSKLGCSAHDKNACTIREADQGISAIREILKKHGRGIQDEVKLKGYKFLHKEADAAN